MEFDEDFNVCKCSQDFKFFESSIEYMTSFAIVDDNILIPICKQDSENYLVKLSFMKFMDLVKCNNVV